MKTCRRTSSRSTLPAPAIADYPVALATLVKAPPAGRDWLHEIKLDGYRLVAVIEGPRHGERARLYTRSQLDWTSRFPSVAAAASRLPAKSAVIDGELVALDDRGVSQFQLLQNSLARQQQPLVYFAFDLLSLDGEDLRRLPLRRRKKLLARLLGRKSGGLIRLSDHVEGRGREFFAACCRQKLEGIISKRADGPYRAGRTLDWLKIKCVGREELVIGGYTDSPAVGRPLGALLMGYFEDGRFVYAGRVGTGFDTAALRRLHEQLVRIGRRDCPFADLPRRERGAGRHWVRPELVAVVEFGSWTDASVLRHASFQGLREDKPARAVGRPESLPLRPDRSSTKSP